MYLVYPKLTSTGRIRYSENMNIVVFPCTNFELFSINQTTLNKERFAHKTML